MLKDSGGVVRKNVMGAVVKLLGVMFVVLHADAANWPVLGVISAEDFYGGNPQCVYVTITPNILDRLGNAPLQPFHSKAEVRLLFTQVALGILVCFLLHLSMSPRGLTKHAFCGANRLRT
jgi:hypothetical protein